VASMWLNVGGAYELRVGCVSIESVLKGVLNLLLENYKKSKFNLFSITYNVVDKHADRTSMPTKNLSLKLLHPFKNTTNHLIN
jgi:hypothetical protein